MEQEAKEQKRKESERRQQEQEEKQVPSALQVGSGDDFHLPRHWKHSGNALLDEGKGDNSNINI